MIPYLGGTKLQNCHFQHLTWRCSSFKVTHTTARKVVKDRGCDRSGRPATSPLIKHGYGGCGRFLSHRGTPSHQPFEWDIHGNHRLEDVVTMLQNHYPECSGRSRAVAGRCRFVGLAGGQSSSWQVAMSKMLIDNPTTADHGLVTMHITHFL